jgi:imidazolonepropionase
VKHKADVILRNARQLVTCASPNGPKRGAGLRDAGLITDGAVAIRDGRIVAVGPTPHILDTVAADREIDVSGRVVCPGFVDCHTHAVYAGDRLDEFEQRIAGATYLEIMAAGGGIRSTVRATRAAHFDQLVADTHARLDAMLRLGTTTAEIKTGYGLDTATEMKMLQVIAALAETHPVDITPTFLAAHAVPPEYDGRADDYIELIIAEMLPRAARWYETSIFARSRRQFCADVFCEQGAFSVAQSRRVLEAARALGLGVRAHVDEFHALGGVAMAVELGALSADHLDVTASAEIDVLAASDTLAVIMPAVNFHLGSPHYADARALIDAGALVALATDLNPGSAPCLSLPLVMAIACRAQKLLPAEALNAATINAAHALGMGADVGSLEVGKQADMLILKAPDYRHLMNTLGDNLVQTVIKRGNVLEQTEARGVL